MNGIGDLIERLAALHERTAETPLFNPVFQLSLDVSRMLEAGDLTLETMASWIAELECDAIKGRAQRLGHLLDPSGAAEALASLVENEQNFDGFAARWSRPQLHAVFTAHPTFLLAPAQSQAVAAAAEGLSGDEAVCAAPGERAAITLDHEHGQAMAALANAQDARDRVVIALFEHAKARWPERWSELEPMPFRFATWVGYDMDGRTDIGWHTPIAYRLQEKARRLERYARTLAEIESGHPMCAALDRAAVFAAERANAFFGDVADPQALIAAADALSAEHPDKLTSLANVVDTLERDALPGEGERSIRLRALAAAMRADGLGMGEVHFRVNASQLHNAIRRRLPEGQPIDVASRGALATLREMIAGAQPLRVNFAALASESSTAIRQFIAMAQILRHIDADAPIRMLIAECEQPATVMAALYFAKLFGIADKVDVSPLFETETALEHGGRLLDALLAEPEYQAYVRGRGRVAIQTGFSDAGRFLGQIPAALAIERLQGRLASAMKANGLTDVSALVFNTHGESMGRGAHPSSFADRLQWPLSPWARQRFERAGIRLEPEVSFQGGDGYLFFATRPLALATLVQIARGSRAEPGGDEAAECDPFYLRTDLSLDFYRAIKEHQRGYLDSRTYARAVSAFGLGLLSDTGSRKSRRQSDLAADREPSLRQIRAIPHNAILQQLGYPVNVIAGFGSAADGSLEEIAALLCESRRGRQMVRLIRAANGIASIKTVAAYGELFNSAFWASRTYRGIEAPLAPACAALAEYLTKDDRNGVFRRLTSRLRVDALKLHRLLALVPDAGEPTSREHLRREIGVLQALRLALLQHMFLKAVSIPAFARANDISRGDVLEMVFSLRIDDALEQLRRAYPAQEAGAAAIQVAEPADYPDGPGEGYGAIHRDYIDPIASAHALNLRIAGAIANHFGAYG